MGFRTSDFGLRIFLAVLVGTLATAGVVGATIKFPKNRAKVITVGPFFDATDGVTPETAMTVTNITCELYHEHDGGGAGSLPTRTAITLAASGTTNDMALIASSASGCYSLELTAAQLNWTGTGRLVLIDTDVMCPWWVDLEGEPNNVYDSDVNGVDKRMVDVNQIEGTEPPSMTASTYEDAAQTGAAAALTAAGATGDRFGYLDSLYAWVRWIMGNMP